MWTSLSDSEDASAPCTRTKHSATLLNGNVYVLGGRNGNVPLKDFWKYNIGKLFFLKGEWYQGLSHGKAPIKIVQPYTLSEAWSGVNWADLKAAQGAFGTDFYDRSTRPIVGTMLETEYRPVIKIGPKGALGSHEIRPIYSTPSLGQSIPSIPSIRPNYYELEYT